MLRRVLALGDDEVQRAFDDVVARFSGRHHGLLETFSRHADELSGRLDPALDALRRPAASFSGPTFTSEYAIEGAALCNPSLVAHPDQRGVAADAVRVVMSVRGIGEGHRSSIGFRTGIVDGNGALTFDPGTDLRHRRPPRRDAAARHRLPGRDAAPAERGR